MGINCNYKNKEMKNLVHNNKVWPKPKFWVVQTIGWCLYPFFVFIMYSPIDNRIKFPFLGIYYAWEGLLGFCLCAVLRLSLQYLWHKSLRFTIIVSTIMVALLAEIWTLGKLTVYMQLFSFTHEEGFWRINSGWYPNSLTFLAAWTAIYYSLKYRSRLIEQEHSLLNAESTAKEAQLKMLRYQLNPHFLFNTLANICVLITEKETSKAQKMTLELSDFLRYSLDNDPLKTNSITEEMSALKLYFNIEKIRYADLLNYRFELSKNTLLCHIPSMLLQPVAENAIKHAIAPSITGGEIIISSTINDNRLILSIKDNGLGLPLKSNKPSRIGIGLKNTKDRLQNFYGNNYTLELQDIIPHGLEVKIIIPLK
ncbi:MAG: histidine kinase [Colwellia sp.]